MLNFDQKIPDLSPVGAGLRASVMVPKGPTYREFVVNVTIDGVKATKAQIIANVEEIVLKINGTSRWEISGANLVALNEYYGNDFSDGELIIPLSRHWARTPQGEENLCWGTRNIQNLFVEVKMAAGSYVPTLSLDADFIPEERDLGLIVEIHEFSYPASVVGKREIASLPTENGSLVAMHLKNADITELEVKVNRTPAIESNVNLDAYQNKLARRGGRTPQAGYVHFDPMVSNRIDDALPLKGAQDFRVNPTVSAAGDIPLVMETLNIPVPSAN